MSVQSEIASWADRVFGPAPSVARVAARANEEMAELLRAATSGAKDRDVLYEAADVVIVLYRLAEIIGGDLDYVVRKKMETNRSREWVKDGTGHGYHERRKD